MRRRSTIAVVTSGSTTSVATAIVGAQTFYYSSDSLPVRMSQQGDWRALAIDIPVEAIPMAILQGLSRCQLFLVGELSVPVIADGVIGRPAAKTRVILLHR